MSETIFTWADLDGTEYSVTVAYHRGAPAQLQGPPENCTPEDPGDFEILGAITDDGWEMDSAWVQNHAQEIEIAFWEDCSIEEPEEYDE